MIRGLHAFGSTSDETRLTAALGFFIFKEESKPQMLNGPISTVDKLKQKPSF